MRFLGQAILVAALLAMGCGKSAKPVGASIHAIGPTGHTWYDKPPQPIWAFTITNTGPRDIMWRSDVEVKGNSDRDYSIAGGFVEWPAGVLGPGRWLCTNMIVPANTSTIWRAYVEYGLTNGGTIQRYNDKWH